MSTVINPTPQSETEEIIQFRLQHLPRYKVILHNDALHTFDEVVCALSNSVSLSNQKAWDVTFEAHNMGRAIVIVCLKEEAEYYKERLEKYKLIITLEQE